VEGRDAPSVGHVAWPEDPVVAFHKHAFGPWFLAAMARTTSFFSSELIAG
jgi:hypothetical protein